MRRNTYKRNLRVKKKHKSHKTLRRNRKNLRKTRKSNRKTRKQLGGNMLHKLKNLVGYKASKPAGAHVSEEQKQHEKKKAKKELQRINSSSKNLMEM